MTIQSLQQKLNKLKRENKGLQETRNEERKKYEDSLKERDLEREKKERGERIIREVNRFLIRLHFALVVASNSRSPERRVVHHTPTDESK